MKNGWPSSSFRTIRRYWMLDTRCSMLDARCSMLDARCSMLDKDLPSIPAAQAVSYGKGAGKQPRKDRPASSYLCGRNGDHAKRLIVKPHRQAVADYHSLPAPSAKHAP
jgi:hypothetical protein